MVQELGKKGDLELPDCRPIVIGCEIGRLRHGLPPVSRVDARGRERETAAAPQLALEMEVADSTPVPVL